MNIPQAPSKGTASRGRKKFTDNRFRMLLMLFSVCGSFTCKLDGQGDEAQAGNFFETLKILFQVFEIKEKMRIGESLKCRPLKTT